MPIKPKHAGPSDRTMFIIIVVLGILGVCAAIADCTMNARC